MELAIHPEDLRAAAAALSACASRLEDAALGFDRTARHHLKDLGLKAMVATAGALSATDRAVQTLHTDIAALAHALDSLARHYPQIDRTAIPRQ
jgi:hypothetical protein